jgi:hypothetical protein
MLIKTQGWSVTLHTPNRLVDTVPPYVEPFEHLVVFNYFLAETMNVLDDMDTSPKTTYAA